jgi:dipeptidyl aminopeptidase/acylaminoacyl peptidase
MPRTKLQTLTPADLLRERMIESLDLCPDGSMVAYAERGAEGDRDVSSIWIVPFAGGRPRRLTQVTANDTRPRFSPDGRTLAFLSDREKKTAQVFLLPLEGGEAKQLTTFRRGATEAEWMPEGKALAVVATDDDSHVLVGERKANGDKDEEAATARVLRRIDWRLDGSGLLDHPTHVHVVSLRGRARRLTKGSWFASAATPHPDGRSIAFLADRRLGGDTDPRPQAHSVDIESARVRQLSKLEGACSALSYDPDGTLLCLAEDRTTGTTSDPWLVYRIGRNGSGEPLTAQLDRFAGVAETNDLRVTPIHDRGREAPYRVGDDRVEPLVDLEQGPAAIAVSSRGDRVAAAMTLADAPTQDVYALEPGREPRRLTRAGEAWISGRKRPTQEEYQIDGPGGPIQTFVMSPPNTRNRPLPTVLMIHGGPVWAWSVTAQPTAWLLAAAGFRVARPNLRGGYDKGRDWISPLYGDWGGIDADDCHAVLHGLVRMGLADPDRLGCYGNSYGGFMVNWLVGTSDRFKAAVSSNGVTNQVSAYAHCDVGYVYNQQEGLGAPLTPDGVEQLWRQSPLRNVANIRTPLLIVQGESDLRCPPADNEQLFVALRMLGREVEYVLYPESDHSMSHTARPDRRVDRAQRIVDWFRKFLR